MRLKVFVIILVSLVLISSIATYFYVSYRVVDVKNLKMYLTVGNNLGFNTDTNAIYFGTVPTGGSSSRTISIKNERCSKCLVKINSEGKISNFINVSNNNFFMNKGESKDVKIEVFVPDSLNEGNYTGTLKIYFLKKTI